MPTWLNLAKGPFFRFALVLLILGLLRLVLLTAWDIGAAVRRAGDRRIPYRRVLREILSWVFPVVHIHRSRQLYSYASFLLHLGILSTVLFLGNHLDILQANGLLANSDLCWFSLLRPLLNLLTLTTILSATFLFFHRIYVERSRKLSKLMDYLLLALILNIFISGFLAGQPWNPVPYDGLMLFHTLNGLLIMILTPSTKIAHCVLYPLVRLGTEIAWHLPAQGGSEAIKALHGPEGRRI